MYFYFLVEQSYLLSYYILLLLIYWHISPYM